MAIFKWYYLQDCSDWRLQRTSWKLSLSSCGTWNNSLERRAFVSYCPKKSSPRFLLSIVYSQSAPDDCPEPPENDACETAFNVDDFPFSESGSTEDATPIFTNSGYGGYYGYNNCQYVDTSTKSVWFTLAGDGACYTASTYGSRSEIIATVLRGTQCGSLVCLGQSEIYNQNGFTWETEVGETYYILVGGRYGNAGLFVLDIDVSDCGTSCHHMQAMSIMFGKYVPF
jgi:hypothetical protein